MNFLQEALTGLEPQIDRDAALRFSMSILLADGGIGSLLRLLRDPHFGGVEGTPGWIIERRDAGDHVGYEHWPDKARFRAYVDPDSYSLAHPEFFCDERTFLAHVRSRLAIYVRHYGPDAPEVHDLGVMLSRGLDEG